MMVDLEALLTAVGLSKIQAKVYLSGLTLESATLTEIATHAKTSKTSTYDALEELRLRKIVKVMRRGKRVLYRVTDPKRVAEVFRTEVAAQAMTIDDIVHALPAFAALSVGRPSVLHYHGTEAVYAYFAHLEKIAPGEILEICNLDDIYRWIDPKVLIEARKTHHWPKKNCRTLFTGTLRNPRGGVEFRVLNPAWGAFHGNIALYEQYVSIVTYTTTLTLVIIESAMLVASLKMLFSVAWRASDEPHKK